ncbi:uncharacterized protein LOC120338745 isoform X1 [Styela clava]
MRRNDKLAGNNPFSKEKESKLVVQTKLKRRKERDESRRERRRVQTEEERQKTLKETSEKSEKSNIFTKHGEKERRSWILGVGNISASPSPTQEGSPKIDAKRRQYNRAMRRMFDMESKKISFDNLSDSSSSTPELKNYAVSVPHTYHEDVYHSSQFQVSNLIPPVKTESETVICRICQSDEDSLSNQLVTPCSCTGSLRYVHHKCLQQWRKTKKASGADITKCELCLKKYDTEILGKTDVKPDQTKKMQEDLRRLVRSGVYLMLLVDFCRDSVQNLMQERESIQENQSSVPIEIHNSSVPRSVHPSNIQTSLGRPMQRTEGQATRTEQSSNHRTTEANVTRDIDSSDNDEYISRAQLKRRSEHHRNHR